jgi:hypothetical protein
MMGFLEWVDHERKKKDKEKKLERSSSQPSPVVGYENQQGQVDRSPSEESTEGLPVFPVSR